VAREYMIRLDPEDLEDPEKLGPIAAASGLTPQAFRDRYAYCLACRLPLGQAADDLLETRDPLLRCDLRLLPAGGVAEVPQIQGPLPVVRQLLRVRRLPGSVPVVPAR
jgi:hypothetical protein